MSEWIERGRGTASLLDPIELLEVVHWMQSDAARDLGYGTELPALVAASQNEIKHMERQRQQRTLRTTAASTTSVLLAVILALAVWNLRQTHEARTELALAISFTGSHVPR